MSAQFDQTQIQHITEWLRTGSINIFGQPFAGKDTQGRQLAELFDAPLIAGGDLLRNSTDHVRQLLRSGKLLPTKEYLEVVLPHLKQAAFANKPLILSSVGRWHGEETSVIEAANTAGHPLAAVVFLQFPEEKVRERFHIALTEKDRGDRDDDAAELLETRLTEFREKTMPVIDFYRDKGLLIEVNGDAPKDQVTTEILNRLAARANRD